MKKFVMQVPKCGVEPAGWKVTFYNGGSGNQESGSTTYSSSVEYKAAEISSAELTAMSVPAPTDTSVTTKIETAGTYSIWNEKGAIVTAASKMSIKTEKSAVNSIVSATNMSGLTATAVPVVGENISSIGGSLTNYVKVVTPVNDTVGVSMVYSTNASTKSLESFTGASYWILVTDINGKILAVKDIGDIQQDANNVKEATAAFGDIAVSDAICFGFACGAGSGGLLIHSIKIDYNSSASGSGSESGSGESGSGESGSGEQGGSQGGESGSSESGSGEQSNTSTTYTLSMDGATITIVANADGTYTASIGENVVETGTYKVSEDGKTVTTTSEKAVTSYTIGDNNVLTVVESGSGSESGSGESSNTSTTYTLSMDGATITIVAKADGTYTASMDGAEVESGTYTLSADGKTVTTTSAQGATSYTIGDNNVLTPVESGEGEQGETCNATFSIKSNVGTDGSLGVVNTNAADIEANLKAEEGSVGATLSFKGNAKIEASAINVQKNKGITTDEFKNAKGSFDLVISSSANVTVHYKASGTAEAARVVVIADAKGNKITGVSPADNSNEYDLTTPSKLAAGTYKIYVNGCKIYSISAKN